MGIAAIPYAPQNVGRDMLKKCRIYSCFRCPGCMIYTSFTPFEGGCPTGGDCELINEDSLKFHMALGFEEANRIICFRKDI